MKIFIYHEIQQEGARERVLRFSDEFDDVSALHSSFTMMIYYMRVKTLEFGSCWRFSTGLMPSLLPGLSIITALIDNCRIQYL
jgi:hypothetical protein